MVSLKELMQKRKLEAMLASSDTGKEGSDAELQEESKEEEVENETESLDVYNSDHANEDDSEVDDDNDLETTKDSDHISDGHEAQESLIAAIKKKRFLMKLNKVGLKDE